MSSIDSSKDHVPEYGRSRSKKGKGGGGGGFKSERRTDSLERGSNSSAVVDGSGTWSVASSKRKTGGGGGSGGGGGGGGAGGARIQFDDASKVARVKKAQIVKREIDQSAVPFLRHLPQYDRGTSISEGTNYPTDPQRTQKYQDVICPLQTEEKEKHYSSHPFEKPNDLFVPFKT